MTPNPPPPASPQTTPSTQLTPASLPPLNTKSPSTAPIPQRQSSLAKDRLSTYSAGSQASQQVSRPASNVGTSFRSSLAYAQVRDFAYPSTFHMHYGPPPVSSATPSRASTPPPESQMRMQDMPGISADPARTSWTAGAWSSGNEQLPQTSYNGPDDHGPPYSEDEDLHSPVVVTSRHRSEFGKDQAYFTGVNGDGSETYYVSGPDDMADGPGGEIVTYGTDDPRHSSSILSPGAYQSQRRLEPMSGVSDESRYSRDYQFTIASPDEEMHGKAVALFDFARENENELPLVEGQVVWVSYRHGQGWLVAEDPRTRESGLVPEEYVRLLRDIEGGLHSLSGDGASTGAVVDSTDDMSPVTEGTTEASILSPGVGQHRSGSNGNGEKQPPVVSTFSTSSRDLDPYPLPRGESGHAPPQVRSGSQPTSPDVARKSSGKEGTSPDSGRKGGKDATKSDAVRKSIGKAVSRSGSNKSAKRSTSRGSKAGKRDSLR